MNPKIVYSDLTGHWYVTTYYKELEDGKFIALKKFDVTDQIEKLFPLRSSRSIVAKEKINK